MLGREGCNHNLYLVTESFGEKGTKWTVCEAADQNRRLGGASFTFEEATGDLARRVESFLEINTEREEIYAFPGFGRRRGCSQKHRVTGLDENRPAGLLGHLSSV